MNLYNESGVVEDFSYTWIPDGKCKIVSLSNFLFVGRLTIFGDGIPLVEGEDYIRVLRSKDILMKFGVDIFAGVVILDTNTSSLDVFGVVSCECHDILPPSTDSPHTMDIYGTYRPMEGSYNDVVNIINELCDIIPYNIGVTLPTYEISTFTIDKPVLSSNISISMEYSPIDIDYGIDSSTGEDISARSDYIMSGIDALPLDRMIHVYDSTKKTYITTPGRLNVLPLNSVPLGTIHSLNS